MVSGYCCGLGHWLDQQLLIADLVQAACCQF
jgi:hypothetical protein